MRSTLGRWTRRLAAVSIAAAFMLIAGCDAIIASPEQRQGEKPRPNLVVNVLDENGQPIAGAKARLYARSVTGAVEVTSTVTDAQGRAVFEEPDNGNYLVYAKAPGKVGSSTFAVVTDRSAVAAPIRLYPISALADFTTRQIGSAGGTIATAPTSDVATSSVAFNPGSLSAGATVGIGTLVGQQIPMVPPKQVALVAVIVDLQGSLTGSATVNLGLPFRVANGLTIPVFAYNDVTGTWTQVAVGTTQNRQVVANLSDLGTISALASFVPRVTIIHTNTLISQRVLGMSDGAEVEYTWIPQLTFPADTHYSDTTKTWLGGTIEQLIGVKFRQPVTVKIQRDPAIVQLLRVYERVDRYTISVSFGSSKPGRASRPAVTTVDLKADTNQQSTDVVDVHSSGFAMGG